MTFVVEYLRMYDPMEWLTIGLVLFAGAQVYIMERSELQSRADRAAQADNENYAAYHYCLLELYRLEAVASDAEPGKLLDDIVSGSFRGEDYMPRDWSMFATHLARLDRASASAGAIALARMVALGCLAGDLEALGRAERKQHERLDAAVALAAANPVTVQAVAKFTEFTKNIIELLEEATAGAPAVFKLPAVAAVRAQIASSSSAASE